MWSIMTSVGLNLRYLLHKMNTVESSLLNCYKNDITVMYECDMGVCGANGNTLRELCMIGDNNLMVNIDTTNITLLIEYICLS